MFVAPGVAEVIMIREPGHFFSFGIAMRTLYALLVLLTAATCAADDSLQNDNAHKTKRISLWNGRASIGEDALEDADAQRAIRTVRVDAKQW